MASNKDLKALVKNLEDFAKSVEESTEAVKEGTRARRSSATQAAIGAAVGSFAGQVAFAGARAVGRGLSSVARQGLGIAGSALGNMALERNRIAAAIQARIQGVRGGLEAAGDVPFVGDAFRVGASVFGQAAHAATRDVIAPIQRTQSELHRIANAISLGGGNATAEQLASIGQPLYERFRTEQGNLDTAAEASALIAERSGVSTEILSGTIDELIGSIRRLVDTLSSGAGYGAGPVPGNPVYGPWQPNRVR